jgi:hypothetical protein
VAAAAALASDAFVASLVYLKTHKAMCWGAEPGPDLARTEGARRGAAGSLKLPGHAPKKRYGTNL